MGMSTARATICSMVASKKPMTRDARMAVARFTTSQENRERVVSTAAL